MVVAPCGTWESPITAEALVAGSTRIDEIASDGDGSLYWSESRPAERGRVALMRRSPDGSTREVTPPDANVRTRVHEYGGGAWAVRDGLAVYSNLPDHRLWRVGADPAAAIPLTPPNGDRYADGRFSGDGAWFLCVREVHAASGVDNDIVAVATDGSLRVVPLVSGADFYAAPRIAPGGAELAWLEWHHPDMPWDHTELWVAELALPTGGPPVLHRARRVAGAAVEAVVQPEWSPEGVLHFCSDRDGWWNLFRAIPGGPVEPVVAGNFEIALPLWQFGQSRYCFGDSGEIAYTEGHAAGDRLVVRSRPVPLELSSIAQVVAGPGTLWVHGGSHRSPSALWRISDAGTERVLDTAPALSEDYFPPPEHITFATEGGEAHALFYRPASATHSSPEGQLPPLIVTVHGGPTSAARPQLSLNLRYWTSRGFAVADVNYRGSTSYGNQYRRALDGAWGEADVADCVAAARYLAQRGEVDPDRLAIRGGSAGGYTVLCALAFHPGVFSAGASYYGVADLEALATDTHKFEARYLDRLIAPYPSRRDVYVERSPIHHVDRLTTPMIVLQGLEDEVVPPNQAEMVVAALRARGVTCEYLTFAGEGHGFRQAANMVTAIEAEAAFYRRVFSLHCA